MALAKQFYSSFKSYNGWDYYLEIWVEGYGGSATEISIGAGGPVITYGTDEQDRFSPILSSKLELPFMVTNTTQDAFIKNIRENFNEQDVYIHLYRASSSDYSSVAPLWSGFVLMDLSASPDLYYPYPVTLTAVDGLSLLKEIDFAKSGTAGSYVGSDLYTTTSRFTYWIKEILLKSGASTTEDGSTQDYKFTTAINWFNSFMPTITQSTDPFYQTKCATKMFFSKDANENFTVLNCYDVLKNLLRHWGARIIYWKHIFYIVQIQEYVTAESGTYANPDNIDTRTYTKTGAFDSSSDNLGDSYWTRYNLLIDDVTGGIQKLAGSQFNYLPQLKRTQAKFIDYGNKNYFGGLPYDLTTGQTDVIYQDTISDVSVDGSMLLIIPLDVTIVTQYQGVLQMGLIFRMYITDGSTTYYLRHDHTNTPKYYWENATTANLNSKKTLWKSNLDNIVGTQTKVGFNEQIEFKDVSGSALTLTGDWDIYTDIGNWGTFGGSFQFLYAQNGLFNTQVIYTPSASTIYWTNTLNPNYQTPLNPTVTGQTTTNTLNPNQSIVDFTPSFNINPFEGKLLIVNASASGALYGSFVSVSPNPITKDSEIVDFGDLIWGDTLLASSEGCLKVWNGSAFVKSNVVGTWGLGSTSGSNSFTEMLLSEYLYGQTKVIESPSMRLVIGETNKNQNDGSGSRPNYINPIGRLKGYSATGTTPYYIFKSGSFHLLKDEVDYQGYQIIRDTQSITKTDDIIIGPDILQDKTSKIGQKTPQTNTLVNKLTQNSYITTVSAIKSAYGNDVAVNGIFATDTGWTKGTGWSIASNKASFSPTGSTSDIKQDTLTNALTYKIVVSLTLSAGGLSVKAGSSGNATVLSASGTYEIFSTCAGSTDVIFEASAAFEGYIEKVVVQQQVPVTSISINAIGTAVFKTNDVLNIADVDGLDVNQFTVSSDQGASDTSISVTSKLITEDILEGSIILVNQNDLAAQYQNKTKGTVGGFDITATSIDSGSVAISSYIDDDSFGTASATSLATSESIKAYVDTQVGTADTLEEVLANGNTTGGTNISVNDNDKITFGQLPDLEIYHDTNNSYIKDVGAGNLILQATDFVLKSGGTGSYIETSGGATKLYYSNSLKLATTSTGINVNGTAVITDNLFIDRSSDGSIIFNTSGVNKFLIGYDSSPDGFRIYNYNTSSASLFIEKSTNNLGIGTVSPTEKFHVVGSAIFTNSTMIGSSSSPEQKLHVDGGNILLSNSSSHVRLYLRSSNSSQSIIYFGDNDSSTQGRLAYNNNGDYMYFNTNASEKMRLDSSGRLLINATSTAFSDKLYINGDAYTTNGWRVGSGATFVGKMFNSSGKLTIQSASNRDLQFGDSNNASIMYIDTSTQKIGIGTASPQRKLHLHESSGSVYLQMTQGSTGTTSNDGFQIAMGATQVNLINRENGPMLFDTNNSTKMSLLANGNLLIGTTTDNGYKTEIAGNLALSLGADRYLRIGSSTNYWWDFKSVSNDLQLLEAGTTSRLIVKAGGNVLIGTTTDSGAKLNVQGSLQVGVDDTGYDVTFYGDTSGRYMLWDASDDSLQLADNTVLKIGTGLDLKLKHDGSNSFIDNSTGNINIRQFTDNGDIRVYNDDGSGGTTEYFRVDGGQEKVLFYKNTEHQDNVKAEFGNSGDLDIYHDGSNSYIVNATGNLEITNSTNDGDIKFRCDDGSGGNATYITIDGSQETINFEKTVLIGTTTNTGAYKIDVAGKQRVQDTLELDDVLMLNAISTPSDPAAGKSVIYMDSSDGGIKCKINVGGTVVTRTIASFE